MKSSELAPLLFTVYLAAASGRSPALPCFAAFLALVCFSGLFAFTQLFFQTRGIGITPVPCLCAVCISLIPDTERYENQRRALPDFHEKLRYLPHVVVPEIEHAVRLEFL